MIVLCITSFSWVLFYSFSLLFITAVVIIIIKFYFVLIIKLFLSQDMKLTFSFCFSSPLWQAQGKGGVSKQLHGALVASWG